MTINRKRRDLLKWAVVAPFLGTSQILLAANASTSALKIPPLLQGEKRGGKRHYALTAKAGASEFAPGIITRTWGYNGSFLGPTLALRRGDEISIAVQNSLNEATTVHWHGMILPAKSDGGPHQSIAPGQTWNTGFKVDQPAATLFYHSHQHHQTGAQVYRGLAGMVRIEDDAADALGLPNEYGVDDIPVILTDRSFDAYGQFEYLNMMPDHMLGKHGNRLLVNGTWKAYFEAPTTLLRLRLVNASNARFYQLGFSDDRVFKVIASDGGLLPQAVSLRRLQLAPAERYEILVDLQDGKDVMLRDFGGVGNTGHGPMRMMGMDQGFDHVLEIRAAAARKHQNDSSPQLARLEALPKAVDQSREFDLQMGMSAGMGRGMGMMRDGMAGMMNRGMSGMMKGGQNGMMGMMQMQINGQAFALERIDFSQQAQQWERWKISNSTPMQHPFHVHNTQFRVVSRDTGVVPVWEQGLKDTVIVGSGETVEIWLPTGPYKDPSNAYMYHCHILEHEDAGMMGQFVVS